MSRRMAFTLIGYGVLLAALGYVTDQTAPNSGKLVLFAGLAGGGLSILAGLAGLAGYKRRVWAILANIAVGVLLLSQTVPAWLAFAGDEAAPIAARLLVTTMFLCSVGISMYLLHAERPPEFYETSNQSGRRPASETR